MKLHDSLTRSKVELNPIDPPHVSLYTCGPTVYLDPHIGNWRTFVFYDTLVRVLKTADYEPKWVMNITDVGHLVSDEDAGEDKLQKTAQKQRKTAWEVAQTYTQSFMDGLEQLNITQPGYLPKATEHIQQQIQLIEQLEAKGFTYQVDDGIYFDTAKLDDYGKLATVDLDQLQAGARIEYNQQKRNTTDFALWKFSPAGSRRDMEWDSPWGTGFPGWHLECSVMAMEYLGQTIDIHAGGVDHINVHHSNEIAQSEAATGRQFANIWLHAEFMQVDGQKMSKSLGNVYLLRDITEHGFSPMALRLRYLQAHYRSQLNFTWESLEAAHNLLKTLQAFADLRWQHLDQAPEVEVSSIKNIMRQTLQFDLNTPKALASLSCFIDQTPATSNPQELASLVEFIDDVFGLGLRQRSDIADEAKQLIVEREQARKAQDFSRADELREQLATAGIGLNDTPDGPVWHWL